ncbi:MAG: hypothetical protein WAN05_24780 [Roseiarcus sp.]
MSKTAFRSTRLRRSASSSTDWAGATTGRLADYRRFERLGAFKPVAMLGGAQAVREPWRNLYAHLMAEMGWAEFSMNFAELELHADLARRPRATLDAMVRGEVNSPKAPPAEGWSTRSLWR